MFPGYAHFATLLPQFDSVAFAAMLIALASRYPVTLFAATQLAMWTDERALLTQLMLLLALIGTRIEDGQTIRLRALVFLLSSASYFAVRWWLGYRFGLSVPLEEGGVTFSQVLKTSEFYWVGIWSYFRGLWLPVGFVLYAAFHTSPHRSYIGPIIIASAMFTLCFAPFGVYDITRSGAYLFPLAVISLLAATRYAELEFCKNLFRLAAIVSLLSGPICIIAAPINSWIPRGLLVSHKPFVLRLLDYVYQYLL